MKLTIRRKLLLLVLIPVLFEYVFVAVLFFLLQNSETKSDQFERSRRAIVEMQTVNRDIAHSILKVMMSTLASRQSLNDEFDELIAACEKSKQEALDARTLRPELAVAMNSLPDLMQETIQVVQRNRANILGNELRIRARMTPMRHLFFPLLLKYNRVNEAIDKADIELKKSEPAEKMLYRVAIPSTLALALILSIFITFSASRIFTRDIIRRIREIEENARRLAFQSELPPTTNASDEIADFSRSLSQAGRKLAETRRKELAVLDVANEVICSLDRRLRLNAVSAGSLKSWGYMPEELLGENIMRLHHASDETAIRSEFQRVFDSKTEGVIETQLRCSDGTIKDFIWSVQWMENTSSFYCVTHDVSAKRAAERMRQRFVSIASHDMRTPLTSVSVSLSLMAAGGMGAISEGTRCILNNSDRDLEQLMQLIQDLLDMEKMDAGKIDINIAAISALDVCFEACEAVGNIAEAADVVVMSPHTDSILKADHRSIVRVLNTMLTYAIDSTESGGTVSVEHTNSKTRTEISILFTPKTQVDFNSLRKFLSQPVAMRAIQSKNIPLGFVLAKVIAHAHGGKIEATTDGSACSLTLALPSLPDESIA